MMHSHASLPKHTNHCQIIPPDNNDAKHKSIYIRLLFCGHFYFNAAVGDNYYSIYAYKIETNLSADMNDYFIIYNCFKHANELCNKIQTPTTVHGPYIN